MGTLVSSVTHFEELPVDAAVVTGGWTVCGAHVIIVVLQRTCIYICVLVVGDNNIGHE